MMSFTSHIRLLAAGAHAAVGQKYGKEWEVFALRIGLLTSPPALTPAGAHSSPSTTGSSEVRRGE